MDTRYFKLKDTVGLDHETGDLQPIADFVVAIAVPKLGPGGEIVEVSHRASVEHIPNTRICKTDNPTIAAAVLDTDLWVEVDPPSEADLKKARNETAKSRELDKQRVAARKEQSA